MICAFASASISSSCSGVTASWWLKSKRRRSGATSEPACLHVRAEHLAQRPVQDVGRGVVAADAVAARRRRSRRRPRRPRRSRPARRSPRCTHERPGAPYCVSVDAARVAPSARRRSCRCRRPGHPTRRRTACGRARRRPSSPSPTCATRSPSTTSARTFAPSVTYSCATGELGRAVLVEQLAVELDRRAGALPPRPRARPRARVRCSRHARVEARRGRRARPRSSAISRVRSIGKPSVSCRKNASLARLTSPRASDARRAGRRPRCSVARNRSSSRRITVRDHVVVARRARDTRRPSPSTVASTSAGVTRSLRAEQVRVPHRAPDDAPQHVAALLVRRHARRRRRGTSSCARARRGSAARRRARRPGSRRRRRRSPARPPRSAGGTRRCPRSTSTPWSTDEVALEARRRCRCSASAAGRACRRAARRTA